MGGISSMLCLDGRTPATCHPCFVTTSIGVVTCLSPKNFQLKHLNPGYWIKNKKKQELTEEQKRQLFAKMENINFNEDGEINDQENYELPEQTTQSFLVSKRRQDKEVLHVKADSL
ncbi:CPS_collapsed_G0016860.mRNA.1.CDS.1 [Saccharomyces cerevisiae]|nr:CPS_collapsed_G0016860.mRNA.1.CDS.1 [Saccharomyces cerevisiae]